MPSFTRSGRPDSSFARSSFSEMTSTAPAGQQLHLAIDVHGSFRSEPSAFGERASAASAPCPRRTTVTSASGHSGIPGPRRYGPTRADGSARDRRRDPRGHAPAAAREGHRPARRRRDRRGHRRAARSIAVPVPLVRARPPGSTRSNRPCATRSAAGTRSRSRAGPRRCASRSAALEVGPGDEVIVPAFTFIATVSAVVTMGADVGVRRGRRHAHARPGRRRGQGLRTAPRRSCPSTSRTSRATWTRSIGRGDSPRRAHPRGRRAGDRRDVPRPSRRAPSARSAPARCSRRRTSRPARAASSSPTTKTSTCARRASTTRAASSSRSTAASAVRIAATPFMGDNLRMTEIAGAIGLVQLGAAAGPARVDARQPRRASRDRDRCRRRAAAAPPPRSGRRRRVEPHVVRARRRRTARRLVAALRAEGAPAAQMYEGRPVYANPAVRIADGADRRTRPLPAHRGPRRAQRDASASVPRSRPRTASRSPPRSTRSHAMSCSRRAADARRVRDRGHHARAPGVPRRLRRPPCTRDAVHDDLELRVLVVEDGDRRVALSPATCSRCRATSPIRSAPRSPTCSTRRPTPCSPRARTCTRDRARSPAPTRSVGRCPTGSASGSSTARPTRHDRAPRRRSPTVAALRPHSPFPTTSRSTGAGIRCTPSAAVVVLDPVAIVANFGIHPTVTGPSNLAVATDWVGPFRRAVEARTGLPACFLQGCQGDVNPAVTSGRTATRRLGSGRRRLRGAARGEHHRPRSHARAGRGGTDRDERNARSASPSVTRCSRNSRVTRSDRARSISSSWKLGELEVVAVPGEGFHGVEDAIRARTPIRC